MESPLSCPSEIYEIMACCWDAKPENRPSFGDLLRSINEILMRCQPRNTPVTFYETIKVSHYN
jgi:hypothetical protein